jgi:glucose/arabinose dehydrogenase
MKKLFLSLIMLFSMMQHSNSQITYGRIATLLNGLCDIASCGDERIFVVLKPGLIVILDSSGVQSPVPFLDLTTRVNPAGLEKGLLSVVFANDYLQSGYFYVYYVPSGGTDSRISRFKVTSDPQRADTLSEQVIITIPQPVGMHYGGDMAFGKDGYLYIGLGDGGGEGDPDNHAQDTSLLLGKFLRLDVSNTSTDGYQIPNSNPFLLSPFPDEVWSIGFRNPWRWSFDKMTGDMWIGDVGQGIYEEIDFQPASSRGGENYGWRCYEGNAPYVTTDCAPVSAYVDPVVQYSHSIGCSVTGGFVYRGSSYHTMFGSYFYSDWCSSTLRGVVRNGNTFTDTTYINPFVSGSVSFGEDRWGDLLVGSFTGGELYRIVDLTAHHVAWISDTDTTKFCIGSTAILQTPVGNGFHYQWNLNGSNYGNDTCAIIVTSPGNYFVTVTNSSGLPQVSDPTYVEFIPEPIVSIIGLDSAFCSSDPVTPVNISPPGGQLFIDGILQSSFQLNPATLAQGNHLVNYRYSNSTGCSNSADQLVRIDACTYIDENSSAKVVIYPVPSDDYLIVKSNGEITFYDVQGKLISLNIESNTDSKKVNIKDLERGFYFCVIKTESKSEVFKWIKE